MAMARNSVRLASAIMKIKSATFEVSAPDLHACPRLPLPEFAFIGRSNVGKSSLINLLAEKRDLARVSDLPGKTRLMNFFVFNNTWRLVDLPGYGYAHVSKQERADFNRAVANFLTKRESLLQTYVLIDPRLPPQGIDLDFIAWLADEEVPFSIVFTKADKQSCSATQTAIDRFRQAALRDLQPEPPLFVTSSKTKDGRKELLAHIAAQLV
jgi:GTP-binding protein